MTDVAFRQFRNAYCKLFFLDRDELIKAGVLKADDEAGWLAWRDSARRPFLWLNPDRERALWRLLEDKRI